MEVKIENIGCIYPRLGPGQYMYRNRPKTVLTTYILFRPDRIFSKFDTPASIQVSLSLSLL